MKSATRNCTLAILAIAVVLSNSNAMAEAPVEASADIICTHAAELVCLTADMKDEIKCHFRGAKGYGGLLAANAVVKAKAAAIKRRVSRNACYKRLAHDANRLDEQVCKLQTLYEKAVACSSCHRPIKGDPLHVDNLLAEMRGLSSCLKAEACSRLGLAPVVVVPVETHKLPPVSEQPIVIEPILDEVQFDQLDTPRTESNFLPRSVLELESDPILELDPIILEEY